MAHLRRGPSARLTDTDLAILNLTANGFNEVEIGERLTIPIGTVKTRLRLMRHALYAENRGHLMAQAIRVGLIDPDDVKTLDEQGRERRRT